MIPLLRRALVAVAFAAAVAPAQGPPFLVSGPVLVDYARLPRNAAGQYVVRFTGTGFVPVMLLVAQVGSQGPFAVPFRFVDSNAIEIALSTAPEMTATFDLYKLENSTVFAAPTLTTQFLQGNTLAANALFVSTSGADSDPGTAAAPFRTITRGIASLAPGMTLYVRGGTYHETPVVNVSGTPSQPIVIQSYPGERAVVDSGPGAFRTPGNQDWVLVDASTGEYQSALPVPPGTPYGYVDGIPGYENGRVGLVPYASASCFRSRSERYVDSRTPFYVGPGLFRDPATGRLHIRLQKTDAMRRVEARYGPVFAVDTPDPRNLSIIVSQAPSTLTILGSNVVVRDLVVNQAEQSVSMPATVTNVLLDNLEVWLGDAAIRSSGAGSSNLTVTHCRVYGDDPLWVFWTDSKVAPAPADLMRQTSVDFRNGERNIEVAYNHVRGGHDLLGINTNETNVFVHHNVLQNCQDDAAELEGTIDVGRVEFHDNYVLNALVAIAPGQDSRATTGPLLFYDNVFAGLRNPPVNRRAGIVTWNGGKRHGYEYLLKQHSGNTFYYHNTMVLLNSSGEGINLTPERPIGTYCLDNILVMVNGRVNGDYRTAAGQLVDGNLYWKMNTVDAADLANGHDTIPALFAASGLEQHGVGGVPRRGTDPLFVHFDLQVKDRNATLWVLEPDSESQAIGSFGLAANSPARNAGVAIPVHPTFGALPRANASADLGALPFGASMDDFRGFPFDQVR